MKLMNEIDQLELKQIWKRIQSTIYNQVYLETSKISILIIHISGSFNIWLVKYQNEN